MNNNQTSTKDFPILKHIPCLLCAAALILCICSSGGLMWQNCILPLILLITASITARPSKTGLAVILSFFVFSFLPVFFTNGDKQTAIHELLKLSLLPAAFIAGSSLKEKNIENIIMLVGIFTAVSGIILYTGIIPGDEWILNDRGIIRLQSTIKYANTAAVIIGAAHYLILAQYSQCRKKIYIILSAVICAAMWLTLSKAALIIYLVIGTALSATNKSWRLFFIENGVCIVIAAIVFLLHHEYNATETLVKRIIYYKDAVKLLKSHIFLGIAPGAWRYYQYIVQSTDYNVTYLHNGWLQLWLENGIIPFLIFAFISVHTILKFTKAKSYTLCAVLILILLHSFVDINLSFGVILIILGFIMSDNRNNITPSWLKICSISLITAITLYGAVDYTIRLRFEKACISHSEYAAAYGKSLCIICPYDSRLRVTLAALEPENELKYINEAAKLSPMDPEINSLRLDIISHRLRF